MGKHLPGQRWACNIGSDSWEPPKVSHPMWQLGPARLQGGHALQQLALIKLPSHLPERHLQADQQPHWAWKVCSSPDLGSLWRRVLPTTLHTNKPLPSKAHNELVKTAVTWHQSRQVSSMSPWTRRKLRFRRSQVAPPLQVVMLFGAML